MRIFICIFIAALFSLSMVIDSRVLAQSPQEACEGLPADLADDCRSFLFDSAFYSSLEPGALNLTNTCSPGTATLVGDNNIEIAYNYFLGKIPTTGGTALTAEMSAGIVGNLAQESGVDPTRVQNNGGPAKGIAQWETRYSNLELFAADNGEDVLALKTQLDFIWFELTGETAIVGTALRGANDAGTEQGAYRALIATTTVAEAATVFEDRYERAGVPNLPARLAYADEVFAQFSGNSVTAVTQSACGPTTVAGVCVTARDQTVTPEETAEVTDPGGGVGRVQKCIQAQTQAMLDAAGEDGLILGVYGVRSTYRSVAQQLSLRKQNCFEVDWYKPIACKKPNRPLTGAHLGTRFSNHMRGLAIDFRCGANSISGGSTNRIYRSNPCWQWLTANAADFGFTGFNNGDESGDYEPWHWENFGENQ